MANSFRIKAFGGVSLHGPEGPVAGRASQRHRLALLALLGVARDRGMTRERIIALLWPEAEPDKGRRLLSDSVYRINQAVGGEGVVALGDGLRIDETRIQSDVAEFADALAAEEWETAVLLQPAPFLDGFYVPGAGDFERWVERERQRLARERARALEALATRTEEHDPVAASRWWYLLSAADPYSSRVALLLMRCLERAGDPAGAVRHADLHASLVRGDLSLEPDPEVPRYAAELRGRDPEPVPPRESAAEKGAARRTPSPQAPGSVTAESSSAPPLPMVHVSPAPAPARHRRRAATRAAVVGIALLVLGLTWREARREDGNATAIASLVVLPFADLSGDGSGAPLADGIAEELITRLSNTPGLSVIGRTSAFAFKDRAMDARQIGAALGVGAVLDGSVRRSGARLRIHAQLIDAKSGFELWSEIYERSSADVFNVQDEIAQALVTRLRGRGAAVSKGAGVPVEDLEAYNLYLNGRYEWHKRTKASLLAAADYFEQSVDRAPDYARAHVGLGDAYAVLGFYDYVSPAEAFPRARTAARRAIELDPELAEPHATLGYVALYYDWNVGEAELEFKRAIELAPGYSTAHQWYANLLTAEGRFPEAVREMRLATELDPLSLIANTALGWVYYHQGDYEAALDQLDHARQLDAGFELDYLWTGLTLEEIGRTEESLNELRRAVSFSSSAITRAALARGLALAGEEREARGLLGALEQEASAGYAPSYEIAKVHSGLGDRAGALAWLERAFEQRSHSMVFLAVDPQLRDLRDLPAFRELVQRVGQGG